MARITVVLAVAAGTAAVGFGIFMHWVSFIQQMGWAPVQQVQAYRSKQNVLAGIGEEVYGLHYGHVQQRPNELSQIRYDLVRQWFGLIFAHNFQLNQYPWVSWLPRFMRSPDDTFCHDLLSYMWSHPSVTGLSYGQIYADRSDVRDWIRFCKQEWDNLGSEEQGLLQQFKSAGAIPLDVTVPPPLDCPTIKAKARAAHEAKPIEQDMGDRYTEAEIDEMLTRSIATSAVGPLKENPREVIEWYSSMNMRKAKPIPGTWAAVGESIRTGKVSTFDARPLLKAKLFNISWRELRDMEGKEASKRIPLWSDGCVPQSFDFFAEDRMAKIAKVGNGANLIMANPDHAVAGGVGGKGYDLLSAQVVEGGKLPRHADAEHHAPHRNEAGYIHARRLPEFYKQLPDLDSSAELGLSDDILRGQAMLWLGATPGGFHYDEESNIYVQLTGETFAFLVPQNWTDYFAGADRHPWGSSGLPSPQMLNEDPKLKDVPIFLVHLKAGDGITLHGRTYHRFMAQTYDRIALNWFFIPKWRKMEYTPDDWYSKEAEFSMPRLALRQLWARTLTRLYEETGKGVIYMGQKLEYL